MLRASAKKITKPSMTVSVESITPEQAQAILSKNTNNRRMSVPTVEYYKRQIKNKQWQMNGETIKIAVDGTLLDGQHRLTAISQSEIPVECLVVRGLDKETISTIDTGKVRTPGDHLRVQGYASDSSILAAASKVAMAFQKDGKYSFKHDKLSPTEIIDWVEGHKYIEFSLLRVPQSIGAIIPRSVAVGLHYIFSMIDSAKAELFFDYVSKGTNLTEGHPVLALRQRLIATSQKGRGNASRRQVVSYCVQAFKSFLEGKKLSHVTYNPEFDIVLEGLPANLGKRFWTGK